MAMCIFKKTLKKYLNRYRRPALCGLAAGFLCGLFGSGGGALLLSVLRKQTDEKDLPSLYATCASAILPLSLFSFCLYRILGTTSGNLSPAILLSSVCGGTVGALLLSRLPPKITGKIFSSLLILGGLLLLLPGK